MNTPTERQTSTALHLFNGFFSRITWVTRYQKGKDTLDLNETRDDGVLGCSGISWTIGKQSAPRSRQITTPTPRHSIFYRPDALPDAQPTVLKHWRHWKACVDWQIQFANSRFSSGHQPCTNREPSESRVKTRRGLTQSDVVGRQLMLRLLRFLEVGLGVLVRRFQLLLGLSMHNSKPDNGDNDHMALKTSDSWVYW